MKRDVSFTINERKQTITVVEEGHETDGMMLIIKRYPWADPIWVLGQKRYLMPDKMTAMVTLQKGDTYSEEVGKKEATRKLGKKITREREMVVSRFEADIRKRMANPAAKAKDYLEDVAERKARYEK